MKIKVKALKISNLTLLEHMAPTFMAAKMGMRFAFFQNYSKNEIDF